MLSETRSVVAEISRGAVHVVVQDARAKNENGEDKPAKKTLVLTADQWKALLRETDAIQAAVAGLEEQMTSKKKAPRKKSAKTTKAAKPAGGGEDVAGDNEASVTA